RVGYMAAPPALIPLFLEQKLLGVLSTSEFDERLVYELLASGAYRKHIERVRERLLHNRAKVVLGLAEAGLQPTLESEGGLFVWAGLPENVDLPMLLEHAAQHGWQLTPGDAFFLRHADRPYLRFNAAASLDSKLFDYLRATLPAFARGASTAAAPRSGIETAGPPRRPEPSA
ncbi:MAG: aminotransferase class I/II-fold pyridoxal phosphate-dependent enzyme, partial [Rhodocyclaceae bacterium]|nr:aminotransferase class I/II-fold pyridoxal phosphate-dependent enzyme [Rhodocyclaceae bacterium]